MGSRSYCFTLFENIEHDELLRKSGLVPNFRYVIFQKEKCPESNSEHYQGYLELSKPQRIGAIKRSIGGSIHLEKRRGTRDEARDYCRKEDTRVDGPWELGSWKSGGAGSRSDLISLKRSLDDGLRERDISEKHFGEFLRYERSIRRYIQLHIEPRNFKTEVAILWGKPGTGKTKRVFDTHKHKDIYMVPRGQGGQIWFDGYFNQKVILIDDFYGWIKWSLMLNLMDRYPLKLPVKGGFVEFTSRYCYITSNTNWESWYDINNNTGMVPDAFFRRIDYIEYFE